MQYRKMQEWKLTDLNLPHSKMSDCNLPLWFVTRTQWVVDWQRIKKPKLPAY